MSDRNAQGNGRGAEGAGAAGVRPGVWTGEAADAQANEDTSRHGARAGAGIRAGRRRRILRRAAVCTGLTAVVLALYLASILTGDGKAFSPGKLIALLTGTPSQDAAFIIGEDRLPRATLGLLAGVAYGAGGVVFQTMLRNQLASPDVIGINAGASAFGVTAILVWHLASRRSPSWRWRGRSPRRPPSTSCPIGEASPALGSSSSASGYPPSSARR